jgi:MFS family permease
MMLGVSDYYLVPYAIALGASPPQVAFLSSVPLLLGAILQIQSARLIQSIGSRMKMIRKVVFFHALSWLPIILIPFVLPKTYFSGAGIWALLAAAMVFVCFGAFAVPAWQSVLFDYIPVKKRGRYFGWRHRLQGIFTVTVSIVAGLVLHAFGRETLAGFTFIFIFAMICRFCAWFCLTRMAEPFRHTSHDEYFSFFAFIKRLLKNNFGRFVLFVSLMSFAANISGPLLPIYLLKDLDLDYASYMIAVTTAGCSAFMFQGIWGYYGDRYGNLGVLKIAGWGIASIPLMWLFARDIFSIFLVQIVAGNFWGGFGLVLTHFMAEAVSPEKRIRCIAYFNVVNAVSTLVGASIGGLLFHRLPPLLGYSYLTLFMLSCLARLLVMIFVAGKVREVRAA